MLELLYAGFHASQCVVDALIWIIEGFALTGTVLIRLTSALLWGRQRIRRFSRTKGAGNDVEFPAGMAGRTRNRHFPRQPADGRPGLTRSRPAG